MHRTVREFPDQPRVDCSDEQVACSGPRRDGTIRQQQLELGRGEIRVDDETSEFRDAFGLRRELGAAIGGATVLPDDRGTNGLATVPVPDDDGFALVRYA